MNNTGLAATVPNVIVNDSCEIEVESAAERVVNIVGYSVSYTHLTLPTIYSV